MKKMGKKDKKDKKDKPIPVYLRFQEACAKAQAFLFVSYADPMIF